MYSKLAACCHCAPNVCGDCLCFRSNEKTMPVMSPMLVTRAAMFASHPVNATMILPYYHAPRARFLPYSHCSGGGGYILYGGGIYYLDNRYRGSQYYLDNSYRGVRFIWGVHIRCHTGENENVTLLIANMAGSKYKHIFIVWDRLSLRGV